MAEQTRQGFPILRQLLAWRLQADALGGLDAEGRKALGRKGRSRAEGLDLGIGARLTRTWQGRPVRASRENANRNVAGRALGSSTLILAPEADISCTTHCRAANPPSRVIHPGWVSALRASRFLVTPAIRSLLEAS